MVSKGNERATDVPRGQLELMPSSTGADEREPKRPESSNVPPVLAVAEPGEGDLPDVSQHELGRLLGNRSPAARNRLRAAMRMQSAADIEIGAHTTVEVTLLDGQVLWDWDRFAIGRELHLPVRFREYAGGDPVVFLCAAGLHERQLSQSLKALTVVSMCEWQFKGATEKIHNHCGFSHEERSTAYDPRHGGPGRRGNHVDQSKRRSFGHLAWRRTSEPGKSGLTKLTGAPEWSRAPNGKEPL